MVVLGFWQAGQSNDSLKGSSAKGGNAKPACVGLHTQFWLVFPELVLVRRVPSPPLIIAEARAGGEHRMTDTAAIAEPTINEKRRGNGQRVRASCQSNGVIT